MNIADALIFGFIATVALTFLMEGSRALGLSRMSLPYLLGTVFTGDRRKAPSIGAAAHVVNGLGFALFYGATFETLGRSGWWVGALLGLGHTAFVLSLLPLLAGVHPRMAAEQQGPTAVRKLQPPGFLGLNYGRRTPLVAAAAHIVYGIILGAFYTLR